MSFSLSKARALGSSSFSRGTAFLCSLYRELFRFLSWHVDVRQWLLITTLSVDARYRRLLTLYSLIRRAVSSTSALLCVDLALDETSVAGLVTPITSSSNLCLFCSGVSVHKALSAPDFCAGAFEPLPVLNLRFRSFVGSARADKSSCFGGASIHSGLCGLLSRSLDAVSSARMRR